MAALPPSLQIADFLPAALGLLGVYLLLPRPGSPPRFFGAVAGLAALGLAGWQMARDPSHVPLIESTLFYCFAGLALFGAFQLVTQPNPARGAVSFALVALNVCGLFLLHGAPFLAAGVVIIYAGAIVVTFLFVIMLCQPHGNSDADGRSREPLLSCAAGALMLGVLFALLRGHYDPRELDGVSAAANAPNATLLTIDDALNAVDGRIAGKDELVEQLRQAITRVQSNNSPDVVAKELANFRASLLVTRQRTGDYPPPAHIALSTLGGPASNVAADRRLPAGNVAALGRVLFSDYLLPVEMAGTLLLVATIGTIAISHRTGRKAV
jgi:NADH-quinone oxidoreductase subunit J